MTDSSFACRKYKDYQGTELNGKSGIRLLPLPQICWRRGWNLLRILQYSQPKKVFSGDYHGVDTEGVASERLFLINPTVDGTSAIRLGRRPCFCTAYTAKASNMVSDQSVLRRICTPRRLSSRSAASAIVGLMRNSLSEASI